jgi:hypothetical protein
MTVSLSQAPVVCPLCGREHARCEFTAGSLFCVVAGCANPHHRRQRKDQDHDHRQAG